MAVHIQSPFVVKYICDGEEITKSKTTNSVPLIPRRGEKIVGMTRKYQIMDVEYDFFDEGTVIMVYLEVVNAIAR